MNLQEEAEKLKEQWNRIYDNLDKPCECIFCKCVRLYWNGRRERTASVLINDQVVYVTGIWCKRTKCSQCKKSWTIRPKGLMARRHYQLCVVTNAADSFLFDADATLSKVANIYRCARRTVGRWLNWIAGIAKPCQLIGRLRCISEQSVRSIECSVGKVAHTGTKPFKRCATNLLALRALAKASGSFADGFQSIFEGIICNRDAVSTYHDPFIPELAR